MTTMQTPTGSGFGAATTTHEVIRGIDLTGKIAIVTGGYSGLGLETARTLSSAGAKVIVPTRDKSRAEKAIQGMRGVSLEIMDLLDPTSIDAFAEKFLSTGQPLHLLINSAGIMATPLTRDKRGYESQFATNHLGHFQLTERLMPALRRAKGARVISVSSLGHRFSPVVFDDWNFERRPYDPWLGYGQSKTANILFAVELDKRARSEGVRAFSLHPGGILDTGLAKHVPRERFESLGVIDKEGKPIHDPARGLKTVEEGAATIVWAATSPKLNGMGGLYCENSDVAEVMAGGVEEMMTKDTLQLRGVLPYAIDPVAAERLWGLSEKLVFGERA